MDVQTFRCELTAPLMPGLSVFLIWSLLRLPVLSLSLSSSSSSSTTHSDTSRGVWVEVRTPSMVPGGRVRVRKRWDQGRKVSLRCENTHQIFNSHTMFIQRNQPTSCLIHPTILKVRSLGSAHGLLWIYGFMAPTSQSSPEEEQQQCELLSTGPTVALPLLTSHSSFSSALKKNWRKDVSNICLTQNNVRFRRTRQPFSDW